MIIKELFAHSSNHGGKRSLADIKYIVIHYTGNNNDKAVNNCKYFSSANRRASAHYFVDEKEIYRSVRDDIVAWSVGGRKYSNTHITGGGKYYGKCTNSNSISIEICDSVRVVAEATKNHVRMLVQYLMKTYKVDEKHVIRHFDVTGKSCPLPLITDEKWKPFKRAITEIEKKEEEGPVIGKVKVNLFGEAKSIDTINQDDLNYVKLRDLSCAEIRVGWDGKNVLVNEKIFYIDGILHKGNNYVRIRSLQEQSIVELIDWEGETKTIIIK